MRATLLHSLTSPTQKNVKTNIHPVTGAVKLALVANYNVHKISILDNINQAVVQSSILLLASFVSQCTALNPLALAQYDDGPIKYPWSDQPEYSSSYGNPSPGHDGYNSYQRQQEQLDRYRQQSLEAERQRQRDSEDHSLGYRPPSVTTLPNDKSMNCFEPTKGNPLTTCF